MTTQIKNYPFELVIAGESPSAVLADQVKSLDTTHKILLTMVRRLCKAGGALALLSLPESVLSCRYLS
jgi:mRNA-degrading endonuclease toxin of MazEF toxin-antitoxin module